MILGNLGADPELNYTKGGMAVCELRVATSRKYKDEEETEWHRVVCWGKTAEAAEGHLSKGSKVHVQGRLKTDQWEDRDGNKRYTTKIQCERLTFVGRKSQGGAQQPAGGHDQGYQEDDVPF
jgi:single-strand DNA-binding protein